MKQVSKKKMKPEELDLNELEVVSGGGGGGAEHPTPDRKIASIARAPFFSAYSLP
ncbi:hypothetical protein [Algicola sagamiensis]|uniref:hypothetical protein n=1 Tax=Algicola sagamiensis TaxID=163869 RepID=UPI000369AF8F|nr:hypothetical protein [Algicola sagamiensis]